MINQQRYIQQLESMMRAGSPEAACQVLKDNPEMMSDEADEMLQALIMIVPEGSQERTALKGIREFIDLCRHFGLEHIISVLKSRRNPTEDLQSILEEISRPARPEEMPRRIELLGRALAMVSPQQNKELWAALKVELGNSLAQNPLGLRAENIERAINHYQEALKIYALEAFPADWAATQNNMANAYSNRIMGDRADNIERAINHYQEALKIYTLEAFPADWAMTQNNLAAAYKNRIMGDRAENIQRAINHYQEALKIYTLEAFPVDWAATQNNLAIAYSDRIRGDRAENIERAINHYQEALKIYALEAFPADWAATQNNMANAYSNRIMGDRADNIERAINHYQEALKIYTLEAFPADWAMTQNNLANAYKDRIRGDRAENIERAINHYQEALKIYTPLVHPQRSRSAASRLGRLLIQLQRWSEAANAFDLAMDATTNLYRGSVSKTSREGELREAGDVYHLAAYSFARSGQLKDAVVALERGRARGLAESLARNRADTERLKEKDAEGHDLFIQAVELQQAVEQEDRAAMASSEPGEEISARRLEMSEQAGAMMEKALERIWQVPGYEDFLKDPGWEVVSGAASDGQALVYLCASTLGGLALIWDGGKEVQQVELNLDDKVLRKLLMGSDGEGGWLRAYFRWQKAYLQSQEEWWAAQKEWMSATLEIGCELWQRVMSPVMEALRSQNARQAVLIPCGLMGLLPLHAAWQDDGGRHRYALEEMTISYAPSARALAHARNGDATSRPKRLMAVDEPAAKGAASLPNSKKEVEAVASHFQEKVILEHEQATLDSVLEALPGSEVAHFSCHGKVEWDDPYKSGLFLAEEDRLSIEEISRLRLEGARMAVLSACETGVIGGPLPDEVISLPGALMGAGFSGVVSTLWSVLDRSSALLMDRFYELWLEEGKSPAEALRKAQMEMMEKGDFQHPVHWAAFYMSGV